MTNVIEGPDGRGCTDHGFPFPISPNPGPFIPIYVGVTQTGNDISVGSDVAVALANMKAKDRQSTVEELIRSGAERRGLSITNASIADTASEVAEQLDAGKFKEFSRGIWPPDKIDLKLDYEGGKFKAGLTISWKFPR